jgi:hypothetical protein
MANAGKHRVRIPITPITAMVIATSVQQITRITAMANAGIHRVRIPITPITAMVIAGINKLNEC